MQPPLKIRILARLFPEKAAQATLRAARKNLVPGIKEQAAHARSKIPELTSESTALDREKADYFRGMADGMDVTATYVEQLLADMVDYGK
jgi:hypothetical protein